jgi:hypothetical protein
MGDTPGNRQTLTGATSVLLSKLEACPRAREFAGNANRICLRLQRYYRLDLPLALP